MSSTVSGETSPQPSRRAARDEEIHLRLRALMDQIRAAAFANGSPKRILVRVEVRFERREERRQVRFVEGDTLADGCALVRDSTLA